MLSRKYHQQMSTEGAPAVGPSADYRVFDLDFAPSAWHGGDHLGRLMSVGVSENPNPGFTHSSRR